MNTEYRPLDDIDVREEEVEAGAAGEGRLEFETFAEGEYVESISISRARALEIYRDLGEILGFATIGQADLRANQPISDRESAAILAALRYWRRERFSSAGHERDIETDFGRLQPLVAEEIDSLCERIARGSGGPNGPAGA